MEQSFPEATTPMTDIGCEAWGKDEMRPVSGSAGRVWGNLGLQLLG